MLSREDNELLCRVGRGTPMGDLLRHYWMPCLPSSELPAPDSPPKKVRLLGEDLIAFRDSRGDVGLIAANCPHRGASLFFGRNEEDGLRCVYHGWKFDTEGHCIEQPCEPDGGQFKDKARQPWYPVEERYGLIFAYMGPAEKRPTLPRYECLENMDDGETVEADDSSIGGGGPAIIPCNWLQIMENSLDPVHVEWLHQHFFNYVQERLGRTDFKGKPVSHKKRPSFPEARRPTAAKAPMMPP